MKKHIKIFMAIVLTAFTVVAQKDYASASNMNSESHVVYYVPHQDDETLTFGTSIYNHLQAGHNVHVVLLTDGSSSRVRAELNMSREDFTEARNKEFFRALQSLGVKKENIVLQDGRDGEITVESVKNTILKFEKMYPNAKHKTFSWTDPHNDHKATGEALKELSDEGLVSDARYYIKYSENPVEHHLITLKPKEYHKPFLLASSRAYGIENASLGLYGIGHRSVPNSFDKFESNPISRYHK